MTGGKRYSRTAGVALGAVAAISYGLNPTFALPLYSAGLNPDSVCLFRYLLAVLIVAVMVVCSGFSFLVPRRSILPLAGLGVLMAMSSLTLFVSYNYMATGIASTILFVYPILVALIMTIFFRERLTFRVVLCLLCATSGIFLLYHSTGGGTLSLKGTLIVIASAVVYAVYLVAVNQKRLEGIPSPVVTFYVLVFGSLLFVGRLVCGVYELVPPSSPRLWLNAAALALFPTVISLTCTSGAIRRIGSTNTAILGALEPVTAVIMGMIFFGEGMTFREACGILLVLVSVSFVIADRKRPR